MSLILEALKKSEAERQRGKAPGLFVEQVVVPVRGRQRAPAWAFALGLLLVVVVGVFGWREWSRKGVMPPPQPSPVNGEGSPEVARVPAPTPLPAPTPVPSLPPAGEGRGEGAPAASQASSPIESLPRLADLPASERNALPALKITMHVFADEPSQRFVILDGQRLAEGATPADGVVIREIRRDGLVLSLRGRDVLLPRP